MTSFPAQGMFNSTLYHYRRVTSTIDIAREHIHTQGKKLLFGTTFIADHQTAGKGQQNNTWLSLERAGLYFTCVCNTSQYQEHNIKIQQPAHANLCMSNAIAKTIQKCTHRYAALPRPPRVQIKWPNDVLVDDKKIAGVLSEAHRDWLILSAGINLTTQKWEHHTHTHKAPVPPTSLQEHGPTVSPMDFYALLLPSLEKELLCDPKHIIDYSNTILWKKNEQVLFEDAKDTITGELMGVRDDGMLVLRTQNNRIVTKSSGHIRITESL